MRSLSISVLPPLVVTPALEWLAWLAIEQRPQLKRPTAKHLSNLQDALNYLMVTMSRNLQRVWLIGL